MPRNEDDGDFHDRSRTMRPESIEEKDNRDLPLPGKKGSKLALILGLVAGGLLLLCGGGGAMIYFAVRGISEAAERAKASNDCKQITIGFHAYASAHGGFPTNSYSADGKPLLSWRVHILPYIEQNDLYRKFNFNEPWDGPTNKPLLQRMPRIYASVAEQNGSTTNATRTYYRGFSNPGALFARNDPPKLQGRKGFELDNPFIGRPPTGLKFADIIDGTSNTIMFLDAGEPVEWTKPEDLDASPGKPFPALGGGMPNSSTVIVAMLDGSVKPFKKSNSEARWRAALSVGARDVGDLE